MLFNINFEIIIKQMNIKAMKQNPTSLPSEKKQINASGHEMYLYTDKNNEFDINTSQEFGKHQHYHIYGEESSDQLFLKSTVNLDNILANVSLDSISNEQDPNFINLDAINTSNQRLQEQNNQHLPTTIKQKQYQQYQQKILRPKYKLKNMEKFVQLEVNNVQYKLLRSRRQWVRQKLRNIARQGSFQSHNFYENQQEDEKLDSQSNTKTKANTNTNTNSQSMIGEQLKGEKLVKRHQKSGIAINVKSHCLPKCPPSPRKFQLPHPNSVRSTTQNRRYASSEKQIKAKKQDRNSYQSSKLHDLDMKIGKYNQKAEIEQRSRNKKQAYKIGKIRRLNCQSFDRLSEMQTSKFRSNEQSHQQNEPIQKQILLQNQNSKQDSEMQTKNNLQCEKDEIQNIKQITFYKKVQKQKKKRLFKKLQNQPQQISIQVQLNDDFEDQTNMKHNSSNNLQKLDLEQIHYFLVGQNNRIKSNPTN